MRNKEVSSNTKEKEVNGSNNRTKTRPNRRKGRNKKSNPESSDSEKLDTSRDNNPAWYFLDEKLADQVSQMSFQNLAGYPIVYDGISFDVPNVVRIGINPSPGVQLSDNYNKPIAQNSAINLAGYRLYSKLSSMTGRVQSYAPQDVSTMILAMGEIISITEFIRRAFGIAYTMNMRNRAYPRAVLEFGMCIDSTDMFTNLSNYRTQFNTLITLINQLPIPKSIAYFDKCAAIYEKIYLDSPSSMAQSLVTVPHSTWTLDESSYSGGTVLKTTKFVCDSNWGYQVQPQNLSVYLGTLQSMIGALLNSSTLQVVYTDILNYSVKVGMEFWRMDYLFEEYQIIPEYSDNFMLQMHNCTIANYPFIQTTLMTSPNVVTPLNDVYPDPNRNCLYYNPCFTTVGVTANGIPRTGNVALIDMMTDSPSVTDRVEVTRYISICKGKYIQPTGQSGNVGIIDTALPDHYITVVVMQHLVDNNITGVSATIQTVGTSWDEMASYASNIDWSPRIIQCNSANTALTGKYLGDVNFYTTVDADYIRKLHDFVGLALYDMRSK